MSFNSILNEISDGQGLEDYHDSAVLKQRNKKGISNERGENTIILIMPLTTNGKIKPTQ